MTSNGGKRATRLALLIDGENLPAKFADVVVAKAATLGDLVEARVYGHFANERLSGWKRPIDGRSLIAVDVPQTNRRKNSADFKLVVEAMDMLHTRHLDGFCIASSDGDFSALAERIRAGALILYIFGEHKAGGGYKALAHTFIDVADLAARQKAPARPAARTAPASPSQAKSPAAPRAPARRADATDARRAPAPTKGAAKAPPKRQATVASKKPPPVAQILAAIKLAGGGDWASAHDIGNAIAANDPTFRVKRYAGSKATLLRAMKPHGVESKAEGNQTYVRLTR